MALWNGEMDGMYIYDMMYCLLGLCTSHQIVVRALWMGVIDYLILMG
jgi:hypothetical protein